MPYPETLIDYNMIGDGTRTIFFVNVSVSVWDRQPLILESLPNLIFDNRSLLLARLWVI